MPVKSKQQDGKASLTKKERRMISGFIVEAFAEEPDFFMHVQHRKTGDQNAWEELRLFLLMQPAFADCLSLVHNEVVYGGVTPNLGKKHQEALCFCHSIMGIINGITSEQSEHYPSTDYEANWQRLETELRVNPEASSLIMMLHQLVWNSQERHLLDDQDRQALLLCAQFAALLQNIYS